MHKKSKIKVCPQCKSEDIDYATQLSGANIGGGDHFYCKNCLYGKFQHVVFEEKEVNSSKKIDKISKGY